MAEVSGTARDGVADDLDGGVELFGKLASQGYGVGLAGLHLAAWEFPLADAIRVGAVLRGKHPIPADPRSGNDANARG